MSENDISVAKLDAAIDSGGPPKALWMHRKAAEAWRKEGGFSTVDEMIANAARNGCTVHLLEDDGRDLLEHFLDLLK